MFRWLLGPKKDWRLVKTLSVDVSYSISKRGIQISSETGKTYFHLFESNLGDRKVDFQSTVKLDQGQLETDARGERLYQERIYPWLKGRVDPDIPRYSEIPIEETATMLRGRKS